jgi:radical SAM protein with 4Fe4S-binding SPASM domain
MTSFINKAKSYLDPKQVGYLIAYVTNRCNFRCSFCFYYAEIEKGKKPNELTLHEFEQITTKLGPLLQLSLTGGEPFIREDLDEITRLFVQNNSVAYLTIPTNAWLTDKMVTYLQKVLPQFPKTFFRIVFSIDGIEEEHDQLRSKPGSFQKIRESYQQLNSLRKKYSNLVLDANSVFSAQSEQTLLTTLKYIHQEFQFDNLSVTYARGKIKDPSLKVTSKKNYEEVNKYLEEIERTEEKRSLYSIWRGVRDVSRRNLIRTVFDDEFVTPCVAGKKLVILGETGDVYPCEILDRQMGNVRDYDYNIKALIQTHENKKLTKWIKDSHCKCSFECALTANVVWNPKMYPELAKASLRNRGHKKIKL